MFYPIVILTVHTSFAEYAVLLDPGHGGTEPGAPGACNRSEKFYNLDYALDAYDKINHDWSHSWFPYITRVGDVTVTIDKRHQMANNFNNDQYDAFGFRIPPTGVDFFLSIHCNGDINTNIHGTEVLYKDSSETGLRIKRSKICATVLLQAHLNETKKVLFSASSRWLKPVGSEVGVLYKTRMPAILLETEYISNPLFCDWMDDAPYIGAVGAGINFLMKCVTPSNDLWVARAFDSDITSSETWGGGCLLFRNTNNGALQYRYVNNATLGIQVWQSYNPTKVIIDDNIKVLKTNGGIINASPSAIYIVGQGGSFPVPPTGIEDYIWVYVDYPTDPFIVNQIYHTRAKATFVDVFPYGDYIVSWGNWKVKALTTCGEEILVYETAAGNYIKIPPLPVYSWDRDANNYVRAKISISGIDNDGHYHENYADILIGNVPNTVVAPIISGFTQSPYLLYTGSSGTVSCNLSQGDGTVCYEWSIECGTNGFSISNTISKYVSIHYNNIFKIGLGKITEENNIPIDEPEGVVVLKCKVRNAAGEYSANAFINLATQPNGCPFVYSWNGEDWMEDNNILPQSQDSSILGQDVTDFYQLYSTPRIEEDKYYLAVGEFENEKSYLDQLKLLVVDHPQETFITVSDEGQVIQFAKPANFASAELDSEDVYKLLYGLDGEQVAVDDGEEMALSFDGVSGSEEPWLLLIGQVPHAAKEKLVGNILGENKESFTSFRLRRNPFYQWVQVPANDTSSLQVNILWKGEAEVDYTELSRRLEMPFTLYTPELINAEHSTFGDVKEQLLNFDENRTELNSNEWITLEFAAPPVNEGMERSFVFVSRGRYETLPDTTVLEGKKQIPPVKKKLISKINTSANEVKEYKLSQNYPNPFNPITTIHYSVKEPGVVTLKLYDLLGREAATLVNENKVEGNYRINFDASGLSSGIYVCRMKVNEFSSLMKMIILK